MFIPPKKYIDELQAQPQAASQVRLRAAHLLIDRETAAVVFGEAGNAYLVYYPDRHTLLLAAGDDEMFKDLHKAKKHLLKSRSAAGDRSVALHEILIDHQIDDRDRDLVYEFQAGLGILRVQL
ncbi:hypothetical protein [Flavilitoribacter nigricans]|uniref:Uncharacterized protein n=1 Tax=Flavilitoribacter nigricans (strain ATCC 23147 / DSM 23189 / NBRC 102662 / NCIMB 1420 / SS-2) TaxID=1122177 RepID=A0A2D0N6P4_FLAN2|nr:hypothetical protein [Flavilitoribacter nigricans]PHN03819.1 hypothetical protein CRP01_25055 [Flavilitoribacter nigricans DSM 23189 = NBRC 102662]